MAMRSAWTRAGMAAVLVCGGLGILADRGPVVGVVGLVVFVGLALPVAWGGPGPARWIRRHPVLDGMVLGPLMFLAVVCLMPSPLWLCAAIGLVASVAGGVAGARRGRRAVACGGGM